MKSILAGPAVLSWFLGVVLVSARLMFNGFEVLGWIDFYSLIVIAAFMPILSWLDKAPSLTHEWRRAKEQYRALAEESKKQNLAADIVLDLVSLRKEPALQLIEEARHIISELDGSLLQRLRRGAIERSVINMEAALHAGEADAIALAKNDLARQVDGALSEVKYFKFFRMFPETR